MNRLVDDNGNTPSNVYGASSVHVNGEKIWGGARRASLVSFDGTAFSDTGWDYFGRHMQNYTGDHPFFTPSYLRNSLSHRLISASGSNAPRVTVRPYYGMSLHHNLTNDTSDTGRTCFPALMIQVEDILKNTDFHSDDPAIMVFRTYHPKKSISWSWRRSVVSNFHAGVATSRYDADSTLPYGVDTHFNTYLSLSQKSGDGYSSPHRNRAMMSSSEDAGVWESTVDLCNGKRSSVTENPVISVLYNPLQGRIDMFEGAEHVHSWAESEGYNPRLAHTLNTLSDKTFHISWHHKPNGADDSSNMYGGPYLRSFIMALGDDVWGTVDYLGLNLPY